MSRERRANSGGSIHFIKPASENIPSLMGLKCRFFILHFTVPDYQVNNNNKYLNSTYCVPGLILNIVQM